MNKLSKRQYLKLISTAMTGAYGKTLREYGTDLKMAEAVLKELTPYLYFRKENMPDSEWLDYVAESNRHFDFP